MVAAAIVAMSATISVADARAPIPAECRNAACVQTLSVRQAPTTWISPQLFYPNNEEVFAAPAVGATRWPR